MAKKKRCPMCKGFGFRPDYIRDFRKEVDIEFPGTTEEEFESHIRWIFTNNDMIIELIEYLMEKNSEMKKGE